MPSAQEREPAPLKLGHGPKEMEIFLEPTCPFCKRAFGKLPALVDAVGADALTVRIRFVSQPWHLFSGIVTRAILAASATEGGKEAALKAMAGIYKDREAFEFEDHHSGPNMDRTPNDIVRAVSDIVGIDLFPAFRFDSVGRALRWQVKYARQNGIHVSPTFAIDRIVESNMGSGQTIEEWAGCLKLPVKAAKA